jgi:hypothetical protein
LLRSEMKKAEQQVGATASKIERDAAKAESAIERIGTGLKASLAGFAAGFAAVSLTGLVSDIVSANVSFQKLNASLATVTGGAANAQKAFVMIEKFAADTPFDLEQVVGAFVKLKSLGLDPSEDALRSYGNTASAMGKSMNDFIEAVADASTSEFERLKEFGIKAAQEGEKVTFTFQGVKTTIGNNAKEIEAYLRKIGDTQFAGAMAREMDTLGGKFANLGDQVGKLQRQVGEGGLNRALMTLTETITDIGKAGEGTAKVLGTIMGGAIDGVTDAIIRTKREIQGLLGFYNQIMAAIGNGPIDAQINALEQRILTVKGMDPLTRTLSLGANTMLGGYGSVREMETELANLRRQKAFKSPGVSAPISGTDPNQRPIIPGAKPNPPAATGGAGGGDTKDKEKEKAAKKAADEAARAAEQRQKVIEGLEFERAQLQRTDLQQEIHNKLKEAGTTADTAAGRQIVANVTALQAEKDNREALKDAIDAENKVRDEGKRITESVRTPTEAYTATVDQLRTMLQAGAIDAETYNRAVAGAIDALNTATDKTKKISPEMQAVADYSEQAFDRIGGAITESFVRGENAFENLRSVGLSVVNELMNAFIKLALINPLINAAAGTALPTMHGWFASSQTGAANFPHLNGPNPPRAIGGPTVPGASYLVGERGPELFEPNVPGRIVPRVPSVSGRGAAAPMQAGPTVVQHLNFALGVTSTVRAEIQNLMPKIAAQSRAAVLDNQARRGRSL